MRSNTNSASSAATSAQKQRPVQTRSRTGCVACRERRAKCDETRPYCTACLTARRPCHYAPPIPLRDRRAKGLKPAAVSGRQQIHWTAAAARDGVLTSAQPTAPTLQLVVMSGGSKDPFDALPIAMPFRSKELLYNFYRTGECCGDMPRRCTNECVNDAVHHPRAMRNTLLLAGYYQAMHVGNLGPYEHTHVFHKVESLRLLNSELTDLRQSHVRQSARDIATLIVIESHSGNVNVAETHLDGLDMFLTAVDAEAPIPTNGLDAEEELLDRYFILTLIYLYTVKARLDDLIEPGERVNGTSTSTPQHIQSLDTLFTTSNVEPGKFADRLGIIRLFPYFFFDRPWGRDVTRVDTSTCIKSLRQVTRQHDTHHRTPRTTRDAKSPAGVSWDDKNFSDLLSELIKLHLRSMFIPNAGWGPDTENLSSWSGFAAAAALYLSSILRVSGTGQPLAPSLHRRLLRIVERDLDWAWLCKDGQDCSATDLWFWKAFAGAMSIDGTGSVWDDAEGWGFRDRFCRRIGSWTRERQIASWREAQMVLSTTVWSFSRHVEVHGEATWIGIAQQCTR